MSQVKIKKKAILLMTMLVMSMLTACGQSNKNQYVTGQYYNPASAQNEAVDAEQTPEEQASAAEKDAAEEIGSNLFMITSNDMKSECLILKQLASGKQYMYYYSVATRFEDKYGNRTTVSYFEPGRIVTLGEKDSKGRLTRVCISDQVWEYPDVTRFSVDEESGIFAIADTNYYYDDSLYINVDGEPQKLSDLRGMDTLRVIGVGKKILSISVTTGHGELKLTNTELFDGSYIQIGDEIFAEITGEMTIEIPEGTYTVTVAHNGYGGSTDVTIEPGREFVLDLDTLKGEGPKYGEILFAIDVLDAVLQIDGKTVDYSGPISLKYGLHTLVVMADSYETYSKKLFVNSEKATIVISLTGESTDTITSSDADEDSDDESTDTNNTSSSSTASAGSLAGSLAGSHSAGTSSSNQTDAALSNGTIDDAALDTIVDELLDEDDDDSTSDYLSTLTELLEALSGSDD